MNTPLFSIITVTYQAENTLPPTLKSVCGQTCSDFEYLIIDGASTDKTVALAEAARPVVTRIVSEPDRGIYDAMNKGVRLASGKYLIFLNAGDSFHSPDTLARLAEVARSCSPDILYGDTAIVDADRRFVGMRHLQAPDELQWRSFRNGMLVCHQAFVVRRQSAPEYDLQYRFSADFDWCIRCMKQAQTLVHTHEILIDYLQEGMTTRHHRASLGERYRIMCRYYGTIPTLLRHIRFALRHLGRKLNRGK